MYVQHATLRFRRTFKSSETFLRCGNSTSYLPLTCKAYEFDIMGAHAEQYRNILELYVGLIDIGY